MSPPRKIPGKGLKQVFGPPKTDESKFPIFHEGDVWIIINGSRQYQLHRSLLMNGSSLLHVLLGEEHTAILSKKAEKKGAVLTNILRAMENRAEDGRPSVILKPVKVDDSGRPVNGLDIGLDLENGMAARPIYTAYEKVLGAFYNKPINLGDFGQTDLKDILPSAMEVLEVAEYLGCVRLITQHFEATLLAMGQSLYRAIAQDPEDWLRLSIRIKSKPLYRESLIHAVGQYKTMELQNALLTFPRDTQEMLYHLSNDIITRVKDITSKMLSYYPQDLMRMKSTGLVDKEDNSRNSYANDILYWMALCMFRQWLAYQISEDHTHNASDMGFDFIKLLRSGTYFRPGSAYLTQPDLQGWHEYFPMSARGKHVIETKLEDIKRQWWEGPEIDPLNTIWWHHRSLLHNESKLEVEKYGAGYFTCAVPYIEVYPWERRPKLEVTDDEDMDDMVGGDESSSDFGLSRIDPEESDGEEFTTPVKYSQALEPGWRTQLTEKALVQNHAEETADNEEQEFENELKRLDPWFEQSRKAAGL